RGADKVAFCRGLGAEVAIDSSAADWEASAREAAGPRGVDAIIDFVQGEPGRRARPLLAVEGRHVMAGHARRPSPPPPPPLSLQNWTVGGCCMGSGYGERLPEIEEAAHDHILSLIDSGRFRPAVGRVVSFDEIPGALRDLAERKILGRVVARVAPR